MPASSSSCSNTNSVEYFPLIQHNIVIALIGSHHWMGQWEIFAGQLGVDHSFVTQLKASLVVSSMYFITYSLIEAWRGGLQSQERAFQLLEGKLVDAGCQNAAERVSKVISEASESSAKAMDPQLPNSALVPKSSESTKIDPDTSLKTNDRHQLLVVFLCLFGAALLLSLGFNVYLWNLENRCAIEPTTPPLLETTDVPFPICPPCQLYSGVKLIVGLCNTSDEAMSYILLAEQPTTIQFRGPFKVSPSGLNVASGLLPHLKRIEIYSSNATSIQSIAAFLDHNTVEEFSIECTPITPEIVLSMEKLHFKSDLVYSRKTLFCADKSGRCSLFNNSKEFRQIKIKYLPVRKGSCEANSNEALHILYT